MSDSAADTVSIELQPLLPAHGTVTYYPMGETPWLDGPPASTGIDARRWRAITVTP